MTPFCILPPLCNLLIFIDRHRNEQKVFFTVFHRLRSFVTGVFPFGINPRTKRKTRRAHKGGGVGWRPGQRE